MNPLKSVFASDCVKTLISYSLLLVLLLFVNSCQSGSGKISASLDTVELNDFRFGLGVPYVTLYENENFRGKLHYLRLSLQCTNIEDEYEDWASSINLHKRCVTVCEHRDCKGKCEKFSPSMDPTVKGIYRLKTFGLNDKISSIKYCYNN